MNKKRLIIISSIIIACLILGIVLCMVLKKDNSKKANNKSNNNINVDSKNNKYTDVNNYTLNNKQVSLVINFYEDDCENNICVDYYSIQTNDNKVLEVNDLLFGSRKLLLESFGKDYGKTVSFILDNSYIIKSDNKEYLYLLLPDNQGTDKTEVTLVVIDEDANVVGSTIIKYGNQKITKLNNNKYNYEKIKGLDEEYINKNSDGLMYISRAEENQNSYEYNYNINENRVFVKDNELKTELMGRCVGKVINN